jgi:hypothetical protein
VTDVHQVYTDKDNALLSQMPRAKFEEYVLNRIESEGTPEYFTISLIQDPNPYDSISGLPALSTRASSGFIRTLVFASDVSSYLETGDKIKISSAGDANYDGNFIIENVSTTTVTYIGESDLDEIATADGALTLELYDDPTDGEGYRFLEVFPFLNTEATILDTRVLKKVRPLEDDTDEPVIPLEDRIVILYGALHRAWSRIRNPEESLRNFQLFERKLARMSADVDAGEDHPRLKVSRSYLTSKRRSMRLGRRWRNF